jgi:hypothetical protein
VKQKSSAVLPYGYRFRSDGQRKVSGLKKRIRMDPDLRAKKIKNLHTRAI